MTEQYIEKKVARLEEKMDDLEEKVQDLERKAEKLEVMVALASLAMEELGKCTTRGFRNVSEGVKGHILPSLIRLEMMINAVADDVDVEFDRDALDEAVQDELNRLEEGAEALLTEKEKEILEKYLPGKKMAYGFGRDDDEADEDDQDVDIEALLDELFTSDDEKKMMS